MKLRLNPTINLCFKCYSMLSKPCALEREQLLVFVPKRNIVYNEELAKRGFFHHKTGYGDAGFSEIGTFKEMEEFMIDYIPDKIVHEVSVLPELSTSNPWPNAVIGHVFDGFHYLTGLPWWCTIITLGAICKASSYPIHVWWRKECQDCVKVLPIQITTFLNTYFNGIIKVGSHEAMVSAFKSLQGSWKNVNVSLLPLYLSAAYPLTMLFGLSYLVNLTYEPLLSGGLLWFTDLSQSDPYFVLPIINSALIIANTRLHPFGFLFPYPMFAVGFKWQVPLALLTGMQAYFSSALLLYCIATNCVGLIFQLLLQSVSVRSKHGLLQQEQLLLPFLEHSKSFTGVGIRIGETKAKLVEIKQDEMKLLEEGKSNKI